MLILGIDAAKTSGWALIDAAERRIVDSGSVLHSFERVSAVIAARDAGCEHVAAELHNFGFARTRTSLNYSTGRWLECLEAVLGVHEKDVSFLSPQAWRKILGAPSRWAGKTQLERRASAKIWSISFAQTALGARDTISDDEAEAACIAFAAGLQSGLVSDTVIPKCQSVASKSRRRGSKTKRGGSTSFKTQGTRRSGTKRRKTKSNTSSSTT